MTAIYRGETLGFFASEADAIAALDVAAEEELAEADLFSTPNGWQLL